MESAAIELMIVNAIERAGLAMRKAIQPMRAPDELLTIQEVAKVLKVGVNYANMLVQSGIIPGIKMNGMKVDGEHGRTEPRRPGSSEAHRA